MATKRNVSIGNRSRISDEAVRAKTGKNWTDWFDLLDKAGATNMSHSHIAAYLSHKQHLPGWWSQMIAVGYEQERGMRNKYEKPGGYEISASKVIPVPIAALYKSFNDDRMLRRWLTRQPITVRKRTTNKSMRITWTDAKTSVEINFYPKGDSKSQVTVQHGEISSLKGAERMKAYWRNALARLHRILAED